MWTARAWTKDAIRSRGVEYLNRIRMTNPSRQKHKSTVHMFPHVVRSNPTHRASRPDGGRDDPAGGHPSYPPPLELRDVETVVGAHRDALGVGQLRRDRRPAVPGGGRYARVPRAGR